MFGLSDPFTPPSSMPNPTNTLRKQTFPFFSYPLPNQPIPRCCCLPPHPLSLLPTLILDEAMTSPFTRPAIPFCFCGVPAKVWLRVEEGAPTRVFYECNRDVVDELRCEYNLTEESVTATMAGIVGHLHDQLQKMENTIMAKVEAVLERVAEKKVKSKKEEAAVPPKATPCFSRSVQLLDDPDNLRITAWASNSPPTLEERLKDYELEKAEEEAIETQCRDEMLAEEREWRQTLTQDGFFQGPSYWSDVGSDN